MESDSVVSTERKGVTLFGGVSNYFRSFFTLKKFKTESPPVYRAELPVGRT